MKYFLLCAACTGVLLLGGIFPYARIEKSKPAPPVPLVPVLYTAES